MPTLVEDYHFPSEEPAERATMMLHLPTVVSVANVTGNASGTAELRLGDQTEHVTVGDSFGNWTVVSFLVSETNTTTTHPLEHHHAGQFC
jgi:hypothetical protein